MKGCATPIAISTPGVSWSSPSSNNREVVCGGMA
jgi:hypothetical protein